MTGSRTPTVRIDSLPESVIRCRPGESIVAIDVIRATTTAVSAAAAGHHVYSVATLDDAQAVADRLADPLMVGELGGNMPYGFDLTNSPVAVADLGSPGRSIVLLSSSGTQLIAAAAATRATTWVACLRNHTAQARALLEVGDSTVLIGAGTRGKFREEDQICCAWIAQALASEGFCVADDETDEIIDRWRGCGVDALCVSDSVQYLRRTDQTRDLDFVLNHVDDVACSYVVDSGRLVDGGELHR